MFMGLRRTLFGYGVRFGEEEGDRWDKIEKMGFKGVSVFGEFLKNKELLKSGIMMIVGWIVFGGVSRFVGL